MTPDPITRRIAIARLGAAAIGAAAFRERQSAPFVPDVELELVAAPRAVQIVRPGPRTDVWSFTGRVLKGPSSALQPVADSYLGPTIRVVRGQKVRIRFRNRLPDSSIVHWHGLDVPAAADGHPRLAIPSGAEYVYDFEVTNRAGTYWYHPHPHMATGPQVYRGLAGMFIVSDEHERALGLPSGAAELTWVLQDRLFDAQNQLVYSTTMMDMETGMLGNRVLVNGQERPSLLLEQRAYRVRVLNGSNARIYKLSWSTGAPMTVIGSDGGLLEQPVERPFVTLAPAQRLELWLDASARGVGTTIELWSEGFDIADAGLDMGGGGAGRGRGMGMGMGRGMQMGQSAGMATTGGTGDPLPLGAPFTVLTASIVRRGRGTTTLPARLSTFDSAWTPRAGLTPRSISLTFQAMEWKLGGRAFEMEGVADDETVDAGSTHLWEFVNTSGPMGMQMAHPIHLHGRQFRVVGRGGARAGHTLAAGIVDDGWMDTVLVLPNERVRVQVRFSEFPGLYLYHCHILEHEDMGMMRNFRIR
jgi:FtsP/CotA-like multicopper oxidase with cupredoxin domain